MLTKHLHNTLTYSPALTISGPGPCVYSYAKFTGTFQTAYMEHLLITGEQGDPEGGHLVRAASVRSCPATRVAKGGGYINTINENDEYVFFGYEETHG